MTTKALTTTDRGEVFALPDLASVKRKLEEVRQFQAAVKELLIEGHDFGVIPGTQKPTLLKPGAEKIDKILNLADTYEELDRIEDWLKPLFFYKFKCQLKLMGTDIVISEGMGSCNSMEARYRYRWIFGSEVPEYMDKSTLVHAKRKSKVGREYIMYRIENDDIFTLANTILKMAKKRAHIDASLSAGRLSDVFTQDIEDFEDETPIRESQKERVAKEELESEKESQSAPEEPSDSIRQGPTIEEPKDIRTAVDESIAKREAISKPLESKSEPVKAETNRPQPKRDPASIKSITELQKALWQDFDLQPKQQLAELNIEAWSELAMTPAEAYRQVASVRG